MVYTIFGVLGAAVVYGIQTMGVEAKNSMRELILRGGPWTEDEKAAILDYCEADVKVLRELAMAMERDLDAVVRTRGNRYGHLVLRGGGGRPNMAQAGGKDPSKLGEALKAAETAVRGLLAK